MALMVQNQGGSIIPMFNDTIAAVGQRVQGWKTNPNLELMDSMAPSECWLKA
jgi:peptide/nickel transport system substrate-binding protein